MAEQRPEGMSLWPLMGTETDTMTDDHSAAVIAEACNNGFTGIDWKKVCQLMMKRIIAGDDRSLSYYRKLNHIPVNRGGESVSKTCEYCYDDWSIARAAENWHD